VTLCPNLRDALERINGRGFLPSDHPNLIARLTPQFSDSIHRPHSQTACYFENRGRSSSEQRKRERRYPKRSIIQNASHLLVAPHDCQISVSSSLKSASTSCGRSFRLAYAAVCRYCLQGPFATARASSHDPLGAALQTIDASKYAATRLLPIFSTLQRVFNPIPNTLDCGRMRIYPAVYQRAWLD
jgi:hypothetical protein